MTVATTNETTNSIVLQMSPVITLDEDSLFDFCQLNSHLRIERTATGEIIIMPPAGSETGNRNLKLIQQLANWTDRDGTGIGFDSSAGFVLPNGAMRSPDASWMKLTKWNSLSDAQKATSVTSFGGNLQRRGLKFAPICPDFVVELRSPSDDLKTLKSKMQEYIDNGASLGWLIDRKARKVYIYRPNKAIEYLDNPATVKANFLLNGFSLDLTKIW